MISGTIQDNQIKLYTVIVLFYHLKVQKGLQELSLIISATNQAVQLKPCTVTVLIYH